VHVDLDKLRRSLTPISNPSWRTCQRQQRDSKPTPGSSASSSVRDPLQSSAARSTGANVLVRSSPSARATPPISARADMTRYDGQLHQPRHRQAPGMSESRRSRVEETDTSRDEPRRRRCLDAYVSTQQEGARGKIDPLIGREAEISSTIQCSAAGEEQPVVRRRCGVARPDCGRAGAGSCMASRRAQGATVLARLARCLPERATVAISRSGSSR